MSDKENKLEDLFKDKFADFEAEVDPGVWKNVEAGLKGAGIGVLLKTIANKIGSNALIAVVSSAATVISTVVVMNWATEKNSTAEKTTPVKPVVETPKPANVEEIKDFLKTEKPQPESHKNTKETPVLHKSENKNAEKTVKILSGQSIASITASNVGGPSPLIVNLSNDGSGRINRWDFGDGSRDSGNNPVHVYDVPGIYTIILSSTSPDGKVAKDSVKVEVLGNSALVVDNNQKVFTPNGDGKLDVFKINAENLKQLDLVIYDERANTIRTVHTEGTNAVWDGTTSKGKPAKEGLYYFIANGIGEDGKKYWKKGKIFLSRQ